MGGKKIMKKQKTLLTITLALALSFIIPLTGQAAPQKMSDGVTFDPQYYADTYPDVVNVYGKTTKRLYQHYIEHGKKEGRKPFDGAQTIVSSKHKVGDTINFGGYQWRVLEVKTDKILVLSEYVLNVSSQYHSSLVQVTWEVSDTRKYLNGDFYNSFSSSDQLKIVESLISTPNDSWYGTPGGNDTTDKIFLLSREEVVKYFGDSGKFANPDKNDGRYPWLDKGLPLWWMNDKFDSVRKAYDTNGNAVNWWLRSPGSFSVDDEPIISVSSIGDDGTIGYFPVAMSNPEYPIGIRPALWLNLK